MIVRRPTRPPFPCAQGARTVASSARFAWYHRFYSAPEDWGPLRILFVGDIFGRPGRTIVHERLPELQEEHAVDLTIANGENAAGGFGITPQIAEELFELGIDVITTGNHIWDKREIIDYMNSANGNEASLARRVLRPANYPAGSPGFGWYQGRTRGGVPYGVINLQGRVFMANNDDPFRLADELLKQITAKVVLVDFHAEATSEKIRWAGTWKDA